MMRTLFVKIFTWFWLAISLVVGVQAVLIATASRTDRPSFPEMTHAFLEIFGHSAAEILEREGCAGLERLTRPTSRGNLQVHLFNEQGAEVCGAAVPDEVAACAQEAARGGEVVFQRGEHGMLTARRVAANSGKQYVAVLRLPPPPMPMTGAAYEVILRLAAIVVTVGLVCYALARWLTAPLGLLREATARLAAGDMTARVSQKVTRRHDEIGTLGRGFDVMAGRIESLMGAQRQLLRDISHEIRSPLARQMIAIDIARGASGPEAAEALEQMERDVRRLSELVSHLLTLSRLESGLRDEHCSIDLEALVRQVSADADFEAQNRGVRVRIERSEPCAIRGEVELIRRAIENVVRNAVQYNDAATEVRVALERTESPLGPLAVITVRDQGHGVPESELAAIFQPFYRLGTARDRQSGGAGLGLAITQRAIQYHGGSVTAYNAPDRGLVVSIRMPLEHDGVAPT